MNAPRRVVLILVMAAAALASASSVFALCPPNPSECTQANDGEVRQDQWYPGIYWKCKWWVVGGNWEPVIPPSDGTSTRLNSAFTYSVSGVGTVKNWSYLRSDLYGAPTNIGASIVDSYTYPGLAGGGTFLFQPAGELRARVIIERWNGSAWVDCRDSGFSYNSSSTYKWSTQFNMGSAPDCGSGSYRNQAYGSMYQAGAWRGSYFFGTSISMQ